MQRLFAVCFPYFINAMENICELYVKAMFIMFALFLSYLNYIKANTIQKLLNQQYCSLLPFTVETQFQSYVKAIYFLWFFDKVDYEVKNLFPKAK